MKKVDGRRNNGGRREGAGRPSQGKGKVPISTYVSPEAKQKLAEIAAGEKQSISETVEMILRDYPNR